MICKFYFYYQLLFCFYTLFSLIYLCFISLLVPQRREKKCTLISISLLYNFIRSVGQLKTLLSINFFVTLVHFHLFIYYFDERETKYKECTKQLQKTNRVLAYRDISALFNYHFKLKSQMSVYLYVLHYFF